MSGTRSIANRVARFATSGAVLLLSIAVATAFAPRAEAGTSTQSATLDGVSATFTYSGTFPMAHNPHLTIRRARTVLFNGLVTSAWCGHTCWPNTISSTTDVVHVVRLQSRGTPEVVLDLYSGGAHCCSIEQVYILSATSKRVTKIEHNFGDPGVRLEPLGPGGATYFVSADDTFAYAFTDFAASGLPIQILAVSGGVFTNVTRRFPALIKGDATSWLRAYHEQASSNYQDSVGVIAAWVADEDLLGESGVANEYLEAQAKLGHLNSALSPIEPSGARFVTALQHFLVKHGYLG
ncbi:MAG: hypothetical protein WAN30_10395 [Acidimicrobiales bacterium]